jgi:hypothetical protein
MERHRPNRAVAATVALLLAAALQPLSISPAFAAHTTSCATDIQKRVNQWSPDDYRTYGSCPRVQSNYKVRVYLSSNCTWTRYSSWFTRTYTTYYTGYTNTDCAKYDGYQAEHV